MAFTTSYFAMDFSPIHQAVAVLATVDQFEAGTPATDIGFFWLDNGEWGGETLDGIRATSVVCPRGAEESVWITGDRGEVWAYKGGQVRSRAHLPDSGLEGRRLGQPNDIRRIAGSLYVCGFAGQIYTQDAKGQWVHMDEGVAEPKGTAKSIDLESIDGTAHDNIYTVGSSGLVFHWGGKAWKQIPVQTNVYLARVRCFAPDDIVIVGEKGVVIEGDGRFWKTTRIPEAENASLYDVVKFRGKLYVASGGDDLYVKKGKSWEKVEHGLDPEKTQFIRMVVGADRLWAMGFKRLNSFDGKRWETHPDPNNG